MRLSRSQKSRLMLPLGGLLAAFALLPVRAQELFVSNQNSNSVTVYSSTANGDIAPTRTITGGSTGLSAPWSLAPDFTNNELFVANPNNDSITVYIRTANGDLAPARTLSGGTTGLSGPRGLALDVTNNELFVANYLNHSITVYSRTANGNVAPTRTISGGSTGLFQPTHLALDLTNDELFVANPVVNAITVYGRTANGNIAPTRTITGGSTGLSNPIGLVLDVTNNELFAGNYLSSSVTVYGRTASGNIAPTRIIAGGNTGLSYVTGLALDLTNNELFVASINNNSIRVYGRTTNGDIAPTRSIIGGATGLSAPIGLALDVRATGTIVLVKQTDPDGSGQTFDFDTSALDADPGTTTLGDGDDVTFPDLAADTYRVDEVIPAGWELDSVSCTVDSGSNDTSAADSTGVDIVVGAGQTVTCTFNNRQLQAGLTVTKTADRSIVSEGSPITWTITVANSGPDGVTDGVVTDDFPSGVSDVTWTCNGFDGAACTASGSGDIADVVDLPAGGEVVYTATGTVNASARGNLENTATVDASGFGGASSAAGGTSAIVSATEVPAVTPQMLALLAALLAIAGVIVARRG